MSKCIVFATGNQGKMREIKEIMSDINLPILSMKEAEVAADVEENGATFLENSFIKARAIASECRRKGIEAFVLADDSGLVIDALGGEPGVYSARYMGEDTSYDIKNANLIERLAGVPDDKRTARFACAIACVTPDGKEMSAEATFEGMIGYESKGENGFGYDPIFYLPEKGKYSAELTMEEKNELSHRGKALRIMKEHLKGEL